MKISAGKTSGRLIVTPEELVEEQLLKNYCLGRPAALKGVSGSYAINDNLVNRLVLELPLAITHPVYTKSAVQLPAGYTLRDYQQRDLEKLGNLKWALNANIPGYGKTLEALMWAHRAGAERILVLCPKSTKYQWQGMCQFWNMFADAQVSPEKGILTGKFSIITNYEQLYNARRLEQLRGVHWDALILDEVHKIRNPDRTKKNRKTITGIVNELPGVLKMGLTGSPIYDRPDDLFSICNWLNPFYVGTSYWDFVNLFCNVVEDFWGRKPMGLSKDPVKVQLLRNVLSYFMVRNTDSLEIGHQEIVVPIELYAPQKKLYRDVKRLAIEELRDRGITIANGMAQIIRLQQVTSNPGLFGLANNPKFEWILDFLESNPDEKIVVFSIYRETILAFNEACKKAGIVGATIHGELSAQTREEHKKAFIVRKEVRVLSGTVGAMGESIDGLQHACRTVIFIDQDWSPEKNNQAKRRVLRLGQEQFVSVYVLEGMGTVDKKVGKVLLEKIEDIKEVLDLC